MENMKTIAIIAIIIVAAFVGYKAIQQYQERRDNVRIQSLGQAGTMNPPALGTNGGGCNTNFTCNSGLTCMKTTGQIFYPNGFYACLSPDTFKH